MQNATSPDASAAEASQRIKFLSIFVMTIERSFVVVAVAVVVVAAVAVAVVVDAVAVAVIIVVAVVDQRIFELPIAMLTIVIRNSKILWIICFRLTFRKSI